MFNKGIGLMVEQLLIDYPALRDDDSKLVATVWKKEIPCTLSSFETLKMIADKKVTNSETIRRTRQLLQAQNPELRGLKYKARHKHTIVVKDKLKDLKTFASGQEQFIEIFNNEPQES